jgi:hypothetical protein
MGTVKRCRGLGIHPGHCLFVHQNDWQSARREIGANNVLHVKLKIRVQLKKVDGSKMVGKILNQQTPYCPAWLAIMNGPYWL